MRHGKERNHILLLSVVLDVTGLLGLLQDFQIGFVIAHAADMEQRIGIAVMDCLGAGQIPAHVFLTQNFPKTSNLTAVSYGQTRWAVSAAFGQRK